MKEMDRLIDIMERLRGPGGCPWDAAQDHKSMIKGLVEEVYELADAVEGGNNGEMIEELGDVLLHVLFHSIIASENGAFTIREVADRLADKLIYRHPHVFGGETAESAAEVAENWEELKRSEIGKKNRRSIFSGIPGALPALLYALKIQSAASRAGFDWDDAAGVIGKIREELREIEEAVGENVPDRIEEEVGDMIFSAVNLARMLDVDPEAALRRTSRKFEARFAEIERTARSENMALSQMPMTEKERIWRQSKRS